MNDGLLNTDRAVAQFEVGGLTFAATSPGFAEAVARAHTVQQRPRCLCRPGGIEMYVARLGDGYIIKRMPETGNQHAPDCPSFEPPAEASGRAPLLGTAIREDPATGQITLRLDFPLTKTGRRPAAEHAGCETSVARVSDARLSLRGLLHYLWDQAGLTKWQPSFAGKRSWAVVRNRLLRAAADHSVGGQLLQARLYVPEVFSVDRMEAIRARRTAQWANSREDRRAHQSLMLLIAELKEFGAARHGFKAVVKHVPDLAFMLDERIFSQANRRFGAQLSLWGASNNVRMLLIATFGINSFGIPEIAALSLVPTTREWLPTDDPFESQLVRRLVAEDRSFIKGLRYNLGRDAPVAAAILTDCATPGQLLFIGADDDVRVTPTSARFAAAASTWRWSLGAGCMPSLPPKQAPQDAA